MDKTEYTSISKSEEGWKEVKKKVGSLIDDDRRRKKKTTSDFGSLQTK